MFTLNWEAQDDTGSPKDIREQWNIKVIKKTKRTKTLFRKLYRHAMKEWHQSIFDEMDKETEIDIGTFYKTAWKNHKEKTVVINT